MFFFPLCVSVCVSVCVAVSPFVCLPLIISVLIVGVYFFYLFVLFSCYFSLASFSRGKDEWEASGGDVEKAYIRVVWRLLLSFLLLKLFCVCCVCVHFFCVCVYLSFLLHCLFLSLCIRVRLC